MDNEQMGRRNREEGAWGESTAADFLVAKGWRIVARNARPCARDRRCEIDIIARQGEYIIFAEVKTRAHNSISRPAQAVDRKKQKKLIRTAVLYLQENEFELTPRFDVIEVVCDDRTGIVVDINHIENAFMLEAPFESYYY